MNQMHKQNHKTQWTALITGITFIVPVLASLICLFTIFYYYNAVLHFLLCVAACENPLYSQI